MAFPWLSVLKLVPWSDVAKNAPVVADGAKKLWNSVARKPASPPATPSDVAQAPTLATLAPRIAELEARTADLHTRTAASTDLLKTLAEQHAQLVSQVAALRKRLLWLAVLLVIVLLATAARSIF